MKERSILFSGSMVRAILEGRKTVTRRPIKLIDFRESDTRGYDWAFRDRRARWNEYPHADFLSLCPYGLPGDRLWVRETFYCDHFQYPKGPMPEMKVLLYYRATDCDKAGSCYTGFSGETMDPPWRPSIHMPRWASRLNLEIAGIKVERLQDITAEQAIAEGIEAHDDDGVTYYGPLNKGHADPVEAFRILWESINGPGSWNANPWVWTVSFRRVT